MSIMRGDSTKLAHQLARVERKSLDWLENCETERGSGKKNNRFLSFA